MSERYRMTSLDDMEPLPGPGTLRWLPVRHELGIGAFGTNAYIAREAGDDVVEPHTEKGTGHEELYFVARGSATFTLDGETVPAPAGTYVFLPDPAVRRHAVADEPGTTVLSFGGWRDRPFEVRAGRLASAPPRSASATPRRRARSTRRGWRATRAASGRTTTSRAGTRSTATRWRHAGCSTGRSSSAARRCARRLPRIPISPASVAPSG